LLLQESSWDGCGTATGSFSTPARADGPDYNTFAVKSLLEIHPRANFWDNCWSKPHFNRALPLLSAAKPSNQRSKGLTPAAGAAAAFPLIALCSCQAEVGASSSSSSLACVHVYAFSARRRRAGAGRRREGPAGSEQTPLAGATRMARASECRNSHLYYYSIKFALSTYATLFSVGAPVAFLSFLASPPHRTTPVGWILLFSVKISPFKASNPCGKTWCPEAPGAWS